MTFEEWFNEIEVSSPRQFRLYEDMRNHGADSMLWPILESWLKAAYTQGYHQGIADSGKV